jgi:DJ-1/PfpI family
VGPDRVGDGRGVVGEAEEDAGAAADQPAQPDVPEAGRGSGGVLVPGLAVDVDQGRRATSHWAVRDYLRNFGAEPVAERVVIEGKVITAGGVSAGIDMALTLAAREAGEDEARALHLVIEYDPQPPYDSGSLEKAEPETKQRATEVLTGGVA